MNFLDTYDVPSTPTPREGPEPSLNEEVNQVVGQLSRFWGGFRKQSQAALETARKDFTQVVSQAQKELTKLTTDPAATPATEPQAGTSSSRAPTDATQEETDIGISGATASQPDSGPSSPTTPTAAQPSGHNRGASVSVAAQNLFTRIQSSLPANLAQTVQAQIPDSIKQGASSIDFNQLRTNLASEFQRVQGITRAQAEEYVHKSEELFREASEYLKEAVKVVPPEEGTAGSSGVPAGVMWDGSDIWMLPDIGTSASSSGQGVKGKGKESQEERASTDGLRAVATRAEALLKQLRHDPSIIRVDPEADERAGQMWNDWLKEEVEAKEGGIEGGEWSEAIKKALEDPVDGSALQKTMDTLVPSDLTSETFWTRYFFRVHQVEQEEERRKALLQGATESEEDFDWESDEESESTPPTGKEPTHPPTSSTPDTIRPPSTEALSYKPQVQDSTVSTPATSSPVRLSSEDSYDVVSSQVSNVGDGKPVAQEMQKSKEEDDENEDEDEDEDENKDENEDEDSDWE